MGNSESAPVAGPFAAIPNVEHVYSKEFSLDAPVLVIKGPIGSRYIFPIITGKYTGGADYPNCKGTVHGPGADWALGHVDGSGVTLDVRLICKSPTGGATYATVVGKSVRDPKDPTFATVSTAAVFESAEEDTKWMNNKILVGVGRKLGSKIVVTYYDLVSDAGIGRPASALNLNVKHTFSLRFTVGEGVTVPNGPAGSKTISHDIRGAWKGALSELPAFSSGTVEGPGTYTERTLPEGHEGTCLDVKLIFKLDSGAAISVTLTGRSSKTTVRTSAVFEVGDDAKDLKWLNNMIYHGIGTKKGSTLSIDYYEVTAKKE